MSFNQLFVKKNVKDATKASYLNSIISLKKLDNSLVKGDLKDIIELRDKLNIKIEKHRETNNITEGQQEAIKKINLEDLKKYVEELKEYKYESVQQLEDYLLMALMVNFPLRNDLQEIKLSTHKQDLKTPFNVLYIPKTGKCILSLKEYKTAHSEGDLILEIPTDLSDDIRQLIKFDKFRKFLFQNKFNKPYSSSSFTHKLHVLTNNKFGIPIGSTLIRKIYLNGRYGDVLQDMKTDSKILGHSLKMQQEVYIPNNKNNKRIVKKGNATIIKDV